MELPPDCIISFDSNAGEAAPHYTTQQHEAQGSSRGFSSSKAAALQQQQQHHALLLSAAHASQYFSAAAGMTAALSTSPSAVAAAAALATGASNQPLSAAYHTLPACSEFQEAWQGCSTPAAAAAPPPQGELELQHIQLVQQQLQKQLCVEDSFDSLAELPLHNPYGQAGGAHCSWAAGAEAFVGEF
jgi:hypothetical protein